MAPRPCRWKSVWILALVPALTGTPVRGQYFDADEGSTWLDRFNPFHAAGLNQPLDVPELCKRLDCLSEKLRDDGLIVAKQPDIFSQARLTHFRNDFETQMQTDLTKFQLVLAARINRLDAATTTQTTNLSAALAAPGASTLTVPSAPTAPPNIPSTATGTGIDISKGPLANIGLANASPSPNAPLALGVDPTVYLDEKSRFLEHLNEIRRINLGPDQNDSSGYGLYLVRLPVSITPGEKTYHGCGADLAVTVEHEFDHDFLFLTYRNLVINNVVDQLGSVIYEVIRSGSLDNLQDPREIRAQLRQLRDQIINQFVAGKVSGLVVPTQAGANQEAAQLRSYILRDSKSLRNGEGAGYAAGRAVMRRLDALYRAFSPIATLEQSKRDTKARIENIKATGRVGAEELASMTSAVQTVVLDSLYAGEPGKPFAVRKFNEANLGRFVEFLGELYDSALPDDVGILDTMLGADPEQMRRTEALAGGNQSLQALAETINNRLSLSLSSTRNPKNFYPIAPRDMVEVFLPENILVMAQDTQKALITKTPRATDVRNYLRQALQSAYDALTYPTNKGWTPELEATTGDWPGKHPPFSIENRVLMSSIRDAVGERRFAGGKAGQANLPELFELLVAAVEKTRDSIRDPRTGVPRPIAAYCWALAVDATRYDQYLGWSAKRVFKTHGADRELPPGQHFYLPEGQLAQETKDFFQDFVRIRWPIITFALDPVTDQQNVADSFNLKRDLQLALSYAFATGQINFGQLNTFRRQIEQSSDTIALNRTVTGFAHGNDTFGFRFTPRFQNPPAQRTNIGVIASQLISGGPGPDYQTRKSKLEAGMREVTAVILVPTFLPTMRFNIATNWFRLTDPEHLVFHSARAMERGRKVQQLRQAALQACSSGEYRESDVRVLQSKLKQLDQMLPQQSTVVQLPFENTASGYDLFSDGANALVPELIGYDGAEILTQGVDADVFIYGKFIHLLDTRVVVGGAYLSPGMFDIISREVVHVHIPSTSLPTTTVDGRSYFEVYLATPSGISNRVLVPCQPKTPPPPNGFDLATDTSSQELDIFYQWMNGADGKPALILTDDPGAVDKRPLKITWDSPTGVAPKTLQANFTGTLSTGQTFRFSLPANSGTKDEYAVDRRQIALILLKRMQSIVTPPSVLPASMTLSVTVQPYIPLDSMGYRVQTKEKNLKTSYTVKFLYNATDKNALPDVTPSAFRPMPADPAVARTSLQQTLPLSSAPALLLPAAEIPPLPPLPVQIANEAAAAVPLAATSLVNLPQASNAGPTAQAAFVAAQNALATAPAAGPQIVVNPSPVVVVPPPAPAAAQARPRSRFLRLFEHRPSNRAEAPR